MKKRLICLLLVCVMLVTLVPSAAFATVERELVTMRTGEIWEFRNTSGVRQAVRLNIGSEGIVDDIVYFPDGSNWGPGATAGMATRRTYRAETTWSRPNIPAGGAYIVELIGGDSLTITGDFDAFEIKRLQTPVFYIQNIGTGTVRFHNQSEHTRFLGWRMLERERPGQTHGLIIDRHSPDGTIRQSRPNEVATGTYFDTGYVIYFTRTTGGLVEIYGDYTAFSGQPYRLTACGQRSFPPGAEETPPEPPPNENDWQARLFPRNSYTYSHELARFAADLSRAVYSVPEIETEFRAMGIPNRNIRSSSLDVLGMRAHRAGYAFAVETFTRDGREHNLIYVIIKGSPSLANPFQNGWAREWRSNASIGLGTGDHAGFVLTADYVYRNLANFLREPGRLVDGANNVFLIAGHSRGGAVSNLLSRKLNDSEEFATRDNIHTYTFASPRTRRQGTNNLPRYNNIFNLINRNDGVTTTPPNTLTMQWGLYGIPLIFTVQGRDLEFRDNHHSIWTYLNWIQRNSGATFELLVDSMNATQSQAPRLLSFNSPVDVAIYDSQGNVVAEIVNNVEINKENSEVFAFVTEDGVKQFFLPYGNAYTARVTATGTGTMMYNVETVDVLSPTPHATKTFTNVTLTPGREFISEIATTPDVRLLVVENGQPVAEVLEDGREIPYAPSLPFTDVPATAWFHDAVAFVYDNNIMRGTSATTFEPLSSFNREQVVGTMFRMYHGRAANESDPRVTPFTDVNPEHWYAPYIAWAFEQELVLGQSAERFGIDEPITRQDFATLMFRYAAFTGADTSVPDDFAPDFPDVNLIGPWAEAGMAWAVYNGIFSGTAQGELLPVNSANRAEAATIIMRYVQTVEE